MLYLFATFKKYLPNKFFVLLFLKTIIQTDFFCSLSLKSYFENIVIKQIFLFFYFSKLNLNLSFKTVFKNEKQIHFQTGLNI